MAQVKVWNENKYDYTEQFRDQLIKIPAGKHIMMEEGEAKLFRGSFKAPELDGNGLPTPSSFKRIRIERMSDEVEAAPEAASNICQACRYEAASGKDLLEHIAASHADIQVRDEEAEREMARKRRAK